MTIDRSEAEQALRFISSHFLYYAENQAPSHLIYIRYLQQAYNHQEKSSVVMLSILHYHSIS